MSSDIIIALDVCQDLVIDNLLSQLSPDECKIKIGKHLFTRKGPAIVERCVHLGFDVFLDLKFHDIPNTVKTACQAAAELGVWMLNVHCTGGQKMLEAAREGIDKVATAVQPLLIGVTVLTSFSPDDFAPLSYQYSIEEMVERFALMAKTAQLDGIVCSANEVARVKSICGQSFLCVTPGIRLPMDSQADQSRVMSPQQARLVGADFLVIGRSITQADDPASLLSRLNDNVNRV